MKDFLALWFVVGVIGLGIHSLYFSTSLPVRARLAECAEEGTSIAWQMHLGFGDLDVANDCQIRSNTHWVTSAMTQLCVKNDGQVACYFMWEVPDFLEVP